MGRMKEAYMEIMEKKIDSGDESDVSNDDLVNWLKEKELCDYSEISDNSKKKSTLISKLISIFRSKRRK